MRSRSHFGLVMIVVLKTIPKNFLSLFKTDLKEKFIPKAESDGIAIKKRFAVP